MSSRLREILASEGLKVAASRWKKSPTVGKTYTIGYRTQRWISTFLGWELQGGEPYMKWKDEDGTTWEAYIFDGFVAVGSSADPLLVLSEA